jgi:hypothetical protein
MLTRRGLIATLAGAPLLAGSAASDFEPIFNGKDLQGWKLVGGHGPGYVVQDGVIVCPADGGGNLFTEKEYANFVLQLEWRLWEGGNNGIGIRAPFEGDAAYRGMEIQILDDEADVYQKMGLHPEQYTGSVYDVFPAKRGFVKRDGAWNSYEILAEGPHIRVTLNGTVVTDVFLTDMKNQETLRRHPGLFNKTGHIGLLGHGSKVEFRNLKVKVLG